MKLPDHVNHIRSLIYKAYHNRFARLGLGENKQQDISLIPEELHPLRAQLDEMLENHIGETGSYKAAREKALDELSFTLFNRIAAIKVMEARHLFPEVITKRPDHGDRSFAHKAWLELNPDSRNLELEGLEFFLEHEFDKLSEKMQLFGKDHPYALMPFTIDLNDIIEAFNTVEKDKDAGADTWQSDDILGWLYESYNSLKKKEHKDSGNKTEFDKVSLQSQWYTPRWVVKFLVDNSLGKLYLEMYPNSQIKEKYAIANAPQTRVREKKPLHEIKLIDPAPGSGNFLLYAFDLFYDLYIDQIENYGAKYNEDDLPALIIENNLYGIDLDDRAIQLAQTGLFIKALTRQPSFKMKHVNVVSSDFYLPGYEEVKLFFEEGVNLDKAQKELMEEVWTDLQQAYRFGSLIKVGERINERLDAIENLQRGTFIPDLFEEQTIYNFKNFRSDFFYKLERAVAQYAKSKNNPFLTTKTNDAIIFLKIIANKYDVAVTNPPYTDSADFGPELKAFIDVNYKSPLKFNINLYATFIKRCHDFTTINGKMALIHPHTFMFIKTFEDVRKFIIEKTTIDLFVDHGLDRANLFDTSVRLDASFYVLSKGELNEDKKEGKYFFISNTVAERRKKQVFENILTDIVANRNNERIFNLPQSKLKIIKSWPFIYWISDDLREKFKENTISDLSDVGLGLKTANNERFLRFWWEIDIEEISKFKGDLKRWKMYLKGGQYNKWEGNEWLVVDWNIAGDDIRNYKNSQMIEKGLSFREGITMSTRTAKKVCGRKFSDNCLFDMACSSIIPINKYEIFFWLAYSNSKLFNYILNSLNPTVNKQPEDFRRLPVLLCDNLSELAKINFNIKLYLERYNLLSMQFKESVLSKKNTTNFDFKITLNSSINFENLLITQTLINESIINERVFDVFSLTPKDKAMVIAKEGESIGLLPIEAEAKVAYLTEEDATKEFPLVHIKTFIEELPEKIYTAEEKEVIVSEFPNLYKSNNDLEEFCIRHQVNPINIWYWFKQSKIVPAHRAHDIAMEFLADLLREILMEDDDGIIPLVRNSGEEVLVNRIEKKFYEKGFSTAQFSQFSSLLGCEIDEYINNRFFRNFSDHLNLFMYLPKTPFIWHITSGKYRAFECYIIIYKWSKDKLFTIKSVYVEKRESALRRELQDASTSNSVAAQEAQERIPRQLEELQEFKQKIDELLAEGYNPILDDGVGKNIAPLQKRGMITYEVLNEGQLKKYLNAVW